MQSKRKNIEVRSHNGQSTDTSKKYNKEDYQLIQRVDDIRRVYAKKYLGTEYEGIIPLIAQKARMSLNRRYIRVHHRRHC